MQLNPSAINKFNLIPEELVLVFIKTANPSVALTVAYAMGKRKVKEAVLARIASFKIGRCPLKTLEAERAFQACIGQFKKIDDTSYLVWIDGKLTITTQVIPKKSMFAPMLRAVRELIEHLNDIKFDHLENVYDCLEQKKTVARFRDITNNIEVLINRSLQKYKKSIISIFKESLHYRAPGCIAASKPLVISRGNNPFIVVEFGEHNNIGIIYNKINFSFPFKNFELSSVENPRNVHYFLVRTLAELWYQNPSAKKYKMNIQKECRPLFYAVGLVSGNDKAEENYQAALTKGRKFAREHKGIKGKVTFKPNPSNPRVLEKRRAVMADPILRAVDPDFFKHF